MITIANVGKSFETSSHKTQILKNINAHFNNGIWTSIIGPSGSGKTTLLHTISGLLEPDQGDVLYNGVNIYDLTDRELRFFRRKNIGFVFQDYKLLPYYSVLDNVALPLLDEIPKKILYEKAKSVLKSVGMNDELYTRLPGGLSGGEKQRVAIARSLINEPKVLICDEPTGNLDIENRNLIIQLLLNLKRRGLTLIVVTHDTEVADNGDIQYKLHHGFLEMIAQAEVVE
ncbi:ABC transporter ATP-binding protein [Bacillus sp. B-jedd]|uniref:ABC transporter ATP-binding protein n=1 Tax=Bacillus sp. B-jedd TaxID=1476857 RepID=UPI0005155E14|nr:ABC transporter ATP-binding protein [Bacillus sp. B-jedd]CEG25471.1 ABC transporter ATP-binding protein [Bacillus sp. B-jedd]